MFKKMIKLIFAAVLVFLNSDLLYPQNNLENTTGIDSITIYSTNHLDLDLNFLINKSEFLRYLTLKSERLLLLPDNSKLWLQSTVTLDKNFFAFEKDNLPDEDILSPLLQQYQNQQKMKPLYYILGTAESAAVGYLAYKHIKKYGFK